MPGAAEGVTCRGLYRELRRSFEAAGLPGADLEARELLCAGTGRSREALLRDGPLAREEEAAVRDLAARHLAGEPVAYLIGEWEFYGLTLTVTPAVLIPRVDTEVLAGEAIAFLETQGPCRVLDLCAGSGCVGLALADQVPGCRVVLGELSPDALAVCGENIQRCGLESRTEVRRLDALSPPPEDLGMFHCLVCNPPYIPDGDITGLDVSVRDFEPHMALRGGADGLDFYRAVIREWRRVLLPGGRLYFEVGIGQAEAVRGLLTDAGFERVTVVPDGQGIGRVVRGIAPEADSAANDVERLFNSYIRRNRLDITLSYSMPPGYEDAFGTFDVTVKTLFLNRDLLSLRPRYEVLFYLFHELRHTMQYLHPEAFSPSIQNSIPYVVLYNGVCFKLVEGVWRSCRLPGDGTYFTRAYENMPYEMDANQYAYETVKGLLPGDTGPLKKLYSAWTPQSGFSDEEYRALFEKIDNSIEG